MNIYSRITRPRCCIINPQKSRSARNIQYALWTRRPDAHIPTWYYCEKLCSSGRSNRKQFIPPEPTTASVAIGDVVPIPTLELKTAVLCATIPLPTKVVSAFHFYVVDLLFGEDFYFAMRSHTAIPPLTTAISIPGRTFLTLTHSALDKSKTGWYIVYKARMACEST